MIKRRKQKNPSWQIPVALLVVAVLVVAVTYQWQRSAEGSGASASTANVRHPVPIRIADDPLVDAMLAAGDFVVRQQLPNADLTYQIDVTTGNRRHLPVSVRQLATVGGLYVLCEVADAPMYCATADRALQYYWKDIVPVPEPYEGKCYSSYGGCTTGATGIAIDVVHKRWRATGSVMLGEENLLETARSLGSFITSLRKDNGEYGEMLYPVGDGREDPFHSSRYNPGESLYALMELYEMTGEPMWLEHARAFNANLQSLPIAPDQWHSHALRMLARAGELNPDDIAYAKRMGDEILSLQSAMRDESASTFDMTTRAEALSSIAQALALVGEAHEVYADGARELIDLARTRQIPYQNCAWQLSAEDTEDYVGGLLGSCTDNFLRVDAVLHWIYGVTGYLEYVALNASS